MIKHHLKVIFAMYRLQILLLFDIIKIHFKRFL